EADPVRMANARKAIADGQREAIDLNITPSGKITVTGGRHRLQAAIEADAPIKVKWSSGAEPAESDVLRHGAKAAPATDTLTGQLRGMQAKLAGGEDLAEMGRGPAAAARAEQLLRHPETADRFMAKAEAALGGGEREVGDATLRRMVADLDNISADLKAAPKAPAAAAEPDSLAARIMRNAEAGGNPTAEEAIARRPKVEIPAETPSPEPRLMTAQEIREQRGRFQQLPREQQVAKAIMRHNGKNVDIGPNLARAAKAIGDVESANAALVDVLGSEAPASAAENAKAYRAALRQQHETSAASAAKTAADLKGKAPEAIAGAGSKLGGLADIGSALEVLKALGVHTPAISAIPVIGPVLGLFFKARAVLGILGRKGGSIGKSTEGLIASKAAAVQDRIAAATDGILAGAAKGAKAASYAAGPAVLLAGKLFPGGADPKGKDPRVLYAARMDELSRAQAPGAIDHAVGDRYQTSDPAMHDALVAQLARGIRFLDSKAPKQTVLPGMLPGDGTWKPSLAALDEFGKYVHAVNDPVSVLEDLAKGHVNMEGAETLRVVYPKLYAVAQRMLLEAAPTMQATLPYARRVTISIMYGIPVDGTMSPSHMQYLKGTPAGPHAAPAIAGPLKLGQQTMSPLDKRAGV
ncbi:MAG TPA: hypothetical protein VFD36_25175, partial [Kofleriaceae bacterium]|nr:hypothetical protein [Kofleriaceae bacterium]